MNFTISAISITLFWGITTRNIETHHVTEHPSNQLPKDFSWGLFQEGYVKYFCFIFETFHLVYQVNNQQPLSRRTNRKSDKQQTEPKSRTGKKKKILVCKPSFHDNSRVSGLLALLQDLATPRAESQVSERCWHMLYFTLPHSPNCRGWESPLV